MSWVVLRVLVGVGVDEADRDKAQAGVTDTAEEAVEGRLVDPRWLDERAAVRQPGQGQSAEAGGPAVIEMAVDTDPVPIDVVWVMVRSRGCAPSMGAAASLVGAV
jgi:hypothetical protein